MRVNLVLVDTLVSVFGAARPISTGSQTLPRDAREGRVGRLAEQIRRRWRLAHHEASASVSTGLDLQCIDQRLDASRIELRDRFIDHDRREVGRFRVRWPDSAAGSDDRASPPRTLLRDEVRYRPTPDIRCAQSRAQKSVCCSVKRSRPNDSLPDFDRPLTFSHCAR